MNYQAKPSHGVDQRDSGRQQVFDAIRQAGRIARIDIARETQISPATVTAITSELLNGGLIEEVTPESNGSQGAKRGRPRVALKVRGDAMMLAGIRIAERQMTVILVDFEGLTIGEYTHPIHGLRLSPEDLVELIQAGLRSVCLMVDRHFRDIAGVGIGLAGLIDATRNFVYWSPALDRRNVAVGPLLEAAMPFPFFLDNDANLVAKAEHVFGEGRELRDFIVITLEQGVGMGIVIDNRIYRGERGCGAEFGHTKVQIDGALCRCGQRGCLEAYVGDYALLREANVAGGAPPGEDLAGLYARAQSGDPVARSIFERAGRMFAMGLVNVINFFDPELVILAGEQMSYDFLYNDEVLQKVKSSVVQVDAPLPEIRVHQWADQMWARGAAAFAMEAVSAQTIRSLSSHVA